MDDRVFSAKIGRPIPEWDLNHRLPLAGRVSPQCRDTATVFRINSTFMDVSDQPHMARQWLAGGVIVAAASAFVFFAMIVAIFFVVQSSNFGIGWVCNIITLISASTAFAYLAIRFGRDEFFSLTKKTVRFNRREKTIYAMRKRIFGLKATLGDFVQQFPWDETSIFCIHRGKGEYEESYHIRCYKVDGCGNVVTALAIGKTWDDYGSMEDLLAQWNYWCCYMNDGPAELPEPLLFLSENETMHESFLYCVYEMGFGISAGVRMVFFPFTLLLASHRIMSLMTCRKPIWPQSISELCKIDIDDPYDQPRGDTPVGWGPTALARKLGTYPSNPWKRTTGWKGEEDNAKNAELWSADIPSRYSDDSRKVLP